MVLRNSIPNAKRKIKLQRIKRVNQKINMPKYASKCMVDICESKQAKDTGISFFKFPLIDEMLCQKWIKAVQAEGITANSKICELHFKKEWFSGKKRKRLKINAVPTEYLTEDSLGELNALINLYAELKATSLVLSSPDSVEEIAARDSNPITCSTDTHIVASDPVKQVMHINK